MKCEPPERSPLPRSGLGLELRISRGASRALECGDLRVEALRKASAGQALVQHLCTASVQLRVLCERRRGASLLREVLQRGMSRRSSSQPGPRVLPAGASPARGAGRGRSSRHGGHAAWGHRGLRRGINSSARQARRARYWGDRAPDALKPNAGYDACAGAVAGSASRCAAGVDAAVNGGQKVGRRPVRPAFGHAGWRSRLAPAPRCACRLR